MVGLNAAVVGGIVLGVLVLIGVWLTWLSLREEAHTPQALRTDDAERPD